MTDRYARQLRLPQIGPAGQQRLADAAVVIAGLGALGCEIAQWLVRAGVGRLRLIDRDVVEPTNLQRQVLFDELDAAAGTPKAPAAARRLAAVNSLVRIEPVVADLNAASAPDLLAGTDVILDGTDNVATRYLVNDFAVKHRIAWVYGGAVGVEGRVMPVVPGSACLRCVFPTPPGAGDLPTCDTAGVLNAAIGVVASMQAAMAIRILVGDAPSPALLVADVWHARFHSVAVDRDAECPCCAGRRFEFLESAAPGQVSLCGRDAVQVLPPRPWPAGRIGEVARRLAGLGSVEQTPFLLRARIEGTRLTLFADGRALIHDTTDLAHARSAYDRWIGS